MAPHFYVQVANASPNSGMFELLTKRLNGNIAVAGVFRVAGTTDDNNKIKTAMNALKEVAELGGDCGRGARLD